jgi:hypothetical protein
MVIPQIGILVASALALPLTLDTFFVFGSLSMGRLRRLSIVLVGCALLYLVPFVLWSLNLLPYYYLAVILGLGLSGLLLWWQYSELEPLSETEKRIAAPGLAGADKVLMIGGLILLIGVVLIATGVGGIILVAGYLVILGSLVMRWRAVFRARRAGSEPTGAPEEGSLDESSEPAPGTTDKEGENE